MLAVLGYVGAFLTAVYTFRMIFRAFHGEPVPEAKAFADGHLHHAAGTQPGTGEEEDTDVGFPGPDHHIAERERPMKTAMGVLASARRSAGSLQIPGVTDVRRPLPRADLRGLALLRRARAVGRLRRRPGQSAP